MKTLIVSLCALFSGLAFADSSKLITLCNVTEQTAAPFKSVTNVHTFDGTIQSRTLALSLLKKMTVELHGAPGAVNDNQAFLVSAQVTDQKSGAATFAQAFFIGKKVYVNDLQDVIAGSLIVKFVRKNQDRLEISCFNPKS